ncbi:MAG: hypothetical protein JO371_06305 [Paraburkholderia sp.]|nr:hypothetical protein [Paraburkholderia sp.]
MPVTRRIIRVSREFADVEQHLSDGDALQALRLLPLRLVDAAERVRAVGTAVVEGAARGVPGTRLAVELSNGVIIIMPDNHKPH